MYSHGICNNILRLFIAKFYLPLCKYACENVHESIIFAAEKRTLTNEKIKTRKRRLVKRNFANGE